MKNIIQENFDEEEIEAEWLDRLKCKKRNSISTEYAFRIRPLEEEKDKCKFKKAISRKQRQRLKRELNKINAKEN